METDRRVATEPQHLAEELNTPAPPRQRAWRRALLLLGRAATWAVVTPPRAGTRAWSRLRAPQQLVLGFAAYMLVGAVLLSLPVSQERPAPFLDHLFTAVSAVSTTGLVTVATGDTYTFFGELVVLALFQLGGIGFMTLSSLLILARGGSLSDQRLGVLRAGFSVPRYFVMQRFIVQVVVFTLACETIGTLLLWWRFEALGVERPLWSAVFHSVSAFATAGFSLNATSLEAFRSDWAVNVIISALCTLGAVGFIVVQDVWYTLRLRERMLTFTSKVILSFTLGVFAAGTALIFALDPSVRPLPVGERLLASAFQAVSASTTAGFNTVPIGAMGPAALSVLVVVMLIGASPSGTGGGMKSTTVSALLANLLSVLRGRSTVVWMGHEVPLVRTLQAAAIASLYLVAVAIGVTALCVTETRPFLDLLFEAVSAVATVGLSTGVTPELSAAGKLTIIALMFAGRCGLLTIGLSLLRPAEPPQGLRRDDLAT